MKRVTNWSLEFIPRGFRTASAAFLVFAAAIILFLRDDRSDHAGLTEKTGPITRRAPRGTPDPGQKIPVTVIRPPDLGVFPPAAPIDHSAWIARAISENDVPAIQSAALSWFEQDPAAARDWLAMQTTYDDLQPAISFIASRISEKGDLETALAWTKLLSDGTLRDDTIFDIHALAIRSGRIVASEMTLDEIPPDRREELLSGAAGD